jgi:hypothetical protein
MNLERKLLRIAANSLASAPKKAATVQSYIPHAPHPKQKRFLELTCREALYGGAAGGGKSDALLMAALAHVDNPGWAAILFRRTHSDLALEGALMERSHEWLDTTDAHWDGQNKRWTFTSGASLTFGYMDDPTAHFRYKSAEFCFIGFDQVEQFPEKQYLYLFSRLRSPHGIPTQMRASANPGDIGHDWLKSRFAIPDIIDFDAVYTHEERVFLPASLRDNPTLEGSGYEENLRVLDEVTYQQLRFGHWVRDTSGLVYSSWSDTKNTIDDLPKLPGGEQWRHLLACDFGERDPVAFAELAFTRHDPCVYVVRSDQWTDLAPSEAAEIARAWEKERGSYDCIVGDVGGLGKAFEVEWRKRFYMPMRTAQKADKLGYIKLLNGDLHNAKIKVLPGNDQLISDVRALAWLDEKHLKEHPSLPNHLPDALLYGWREARHWAWEERPPPKAYEDERLEAKLRRMNEDRAPWWRSA